MDQTINSEHTPKPLRDKLGVEGDYGLSSATQQSHIRNGYSANLAGNTVLSVMAPEDLALQRLGEDPAMNMQDRL